MTSNTVFYRHQLQDFGKPNCSRFAVPRRADSEGRATGIWLRRHAGGDGGCSITVAITVLSSSCSFQRCLAAPQCRRQRWGLV